MKTTTIKKAVVAVASKLRNSKTITVTDEVIAAHGDLEGYIEAAFHAHLAKDTAALKRNLRDAQMIHTARQIELPGMEHAAVPAYVERKDAESGETFMVPMEDATKAEVRKEVSRMRRKHNTQDRVITGYEATLARMDELGLSDDYTMAEIEESVKIGIEQ